MVAIQAPEITTSRQMSLLPMGRVTTKWKKMWMSGHETTLIPVYLVQRQTSSCVVGEDTDIGTVGPDIQIQIKFLC